MIRRTYFCAACTENPLPIRSCKTCTAIYRKMTRKQANAYQNRWREENRDRWLWLCKQGRIRRAARMEGRI